jgi:hypothetical protein
MRRSSQGGDVADAGSWVVTPYDLVQSLRGGVDSGAVQGESVLVGGLKGCYWWKPV